MLHDINKEHKEEMHMSATHIKYIMMSSVQEFLSFFLHIGHLLQLTSLEPHMTYIDEYHCISYSEATYKQL